MSPRFVEIFENRKSFLPLLLLADEQENMIDRYLDRGRMFALMRDEDTIAVLVATDEGNGVVEIKNLAVARKHQGRGYGRMMIEYAADLFGGCYHTMTVGTGDSPLTVPFYEKCGFARSHIVKDFFLHHYDHPIVEAGVLLRDMVYFSRAI